MGIIREDEVNNTRWRDEVAVELERCHAEIELHDGRIFMAIMIVKLPNGSAVNEILRSLVDDGYTVEYDYTPFTGYYWFAIGTRTGRRGPCKSLT